MNFKKNILVIVFAFVSLASAGCSAKRDLVKSDSDQPVQTTAVAEPAGDSNAATTPSAPRKADAGTADGTVVAEETVDTPVSGGDAAAAAKTGPETIYFDFDAYLLSTEARASLSRSAAYLSENKLTRVILAGHADERGSDDYNLALGEKRALAVKRYLESLGIGADRMDVISYGEDKPAVEGDNEAAWAKNRRVDFSPAR